MPYTDPGLLNVGDFVDEVLWNRMVTNIRAVRGAPRARVYLSAAASIPNGGTLTNVFFDQEFYDSHGMHSVVSNSDRLTIPANWTGEWSIKACVEWEPSASGAVRNAELWINNSLLIAADVRPPTATAGYCVQTLSADFGGAPGDFYTLKVSHDAATSLDVKPNGYGGTALSMHYIGGGVG